MDNRTDLDLGAEYTTTLELSLESPEEDVVSDSESEGSLRLRASGIASMMDEILQLDRIDAMPIPQPLVGETPPIFIRRLIQEGCMNYMLISCDYCISEQIRCDHVIVPYRIDEQYSVTMPWHDHYASVHYPNHRVFSTEITGSRNLMSDITLNHGN